MNARRRPDESFQAAGRDEIVSKLRRLSHPLRELRDLDPLIEQAGRARYVLLGEASHGTSEFYLWRARISQRLLEEKGFSFVAVEGDWPGCQRLNRYVKDYRDAGSAASAVLGEFARWPTWIWANWEVAAFLEWLRARNRSRSDKAGFYGLDVYSLWESLEAVLRYLEEKQPEAVPAALRAFRCFEAQAQDAEAYARNAALTPDSCEREVLELLLALRRRAAISEGDEEARLCAEQNAVVTASAEQYYRAMLRGGVTSWNIRDHHMMETIERLMAFHGSQARAIIWAHNTHVGDARATDMRAAGMVNIGELVRERHGREAAFLVGFSSARGTVVAGQEWGVPMETMIVPEARAGSWDEILHESAGADALIRLWEERPEQGPGHEPVIHPGAERFRHEGVAGVEAAGGEGSDPVLDPRGHRAIGVVYHPGQEHSNYVPTVLPRRYDALLYLEESHALHPLVIDARPSMQPDLFPWGF